MLVAFGGVVVPLLGWLSGFAMMWASKSWRLWEKWVATLTPPLVVAFLVLIFGLLRGVGGGSDPSVPEPQLPFLFDVWWSYLLQAIVLNAIVGIWLLWRGLRRAKALPA